MMIPRLFRPPHTDPDPAKRTLAAQELAADSDELAALLADPVPEVRAAAAARCGRLDPLVAAWAAEQDNAARGAIADALVRLLATAGDGGVAAAFLRTQACTDAIRAGVARCAQDGEVQRAAIDAIGDEAALVDLALAGERSELRLAAAERVHSPEALRRLADAARDKDRGVARLARARIDAITASTQQGAEADEILARLEALAAHDGPIPGELIALDRRWAKLPLAQDETRRARREAAQRALEERFDRERAAQQAQLRFDRAVDELAAVEDAAHTPEELAALHARLASLRDAAERSGDDAARARLQAVGERLDVWAREADLRAGAVALVVDAERLAESTSIDNAGLPERWQALPFAIRTPALTRRFEAALMRIEQHRLAQVHAAEQQANAVRRELHQVLHAAEQALAAGQVHAAREAADQVKARKPGAGTLPKPTHQRISRLVQQLAELERWESFGQRQARETLCARAEALLATPTDATGLAAEVRKLREEWKALDQQHAGVPRTLWERFDQACEKAYAPAARHFAEMAAQKAEARRRRVAFIEAAAAKAAELLGQEPRDWRAVERWLRDTDHAWRVGELGSVDPKAWKALDARLRDAVAPLREALAVGRSGAKAGRQALVDEAQSLAAKAMEHDAPSRVKELQARWQANAREMPLHPRDERALWDAFRAACNAVFEARHAKRRQEDAAKSDAHRALEAIVAELEQLAAAGLDEAETRRALRDAESRWRKQHDERDHGARGIESRYRKARTAVEVALAARSRERQASVWQTLAAKERLCEEVDSMALAARAPVDDTVTADVRGRWDALPQLSGAWEKRMIARRDHALASLADVDRAQARAAAIDEARPVRERQLLDLEIALGLPSPAELNAQRLALQVARLRDRFQSAGGAQSAQETLLAWCAEPGVADARDRQRIERVLVAIAHGLARTPGASH
jgi:hypothetical protein